MAQTLTRRAWLRRSVATASGILGAALLAACGSTTATTGSTTSAAAQAPASTVVITQTAVQTVTVASVQTVTQTAVQTVTQTAVQTITVSASAPAVKAIALDFWNPAGDTNGKAIIADLVNKWNDQNPTLPVKDTVVDNNNDYEKYTAALAGGAPP